MAEGAGRAGGCRVSNYSLHFCGAMGLCICAASGMEPMGGKQRSSA